MYKCYTLHPRITSDLMVIKSLGRRKDVCGSPFVLALISNNTHTHTRAAEEKTARHMNVIGNRVNV